MVKEMKNKKIRVVAYARVSTQKQVNDGNSLENQRSYFERELEKNTAYQLVSLPSNSHGIYADEGISGTKLKRPAFDRMMKDAGLAPIISDRTGKDSDDYEIVGEPSFDVIFVKDTSRFARNVSVDRLLKTLLKNGVSVHFLDIGKTSDSNEDMTYIQIFLTFSERESRDKSRKVRFGHREAHRRGDIATGGKVYGYNYVKKDKQHPYETGLFTIDEKEAELVRKIFDLYTEYGLGDYRICVKLYEEGYRNRNGNVFTTNTIARILKNEKYTGVNDAGKYDYGVDIFHKKITDAPYNTQDRIMAREATKQLKENGIVDRIPAIISVEQFVKAQEIRAQHCDQNKVVKAKYNGVTPYAKKVVCGKCGAYYISSSKQIVEGKRIRRYACMHRQRYNNDTIEKCMNPSVLETDLDKLITSKEFYHKKIEAFDDLLGAIIIAIDTLENAKNIDAEKQAEPLRRNLNTLQDKKSKLLDLYLDDKFSKKDLDSRVQSINNEITVLDKSIIQLTKTNEELEKQIRYLKQLYSEVETEQKELNVSMKDENIDIRKQLMDIEKIVVDLDGSLSMVLKSETELYQISDYIDDIINPYKL